MGAIAVHTRTQPLPGQDDQPTGAPHLAKIAALSLPRRQQPNVVICLLLTAGIEILDNIPTVAASTAPQPRAVSGDCLGGAILRACCAAHREGQHPARRAAASHLLAALQGSLRDLGTCLLAHALAEAHGSGRGDAEGNASSGVPGEQQPGEANERKEAIPECSAAYIKYAEAWSSRAAIANGEDEDTDEEDAGPSSSAQVLADDLRRCLRWGLEDATAVVLQLLLSEGPLVELAAGNPGVVELVAAAFMPQQVSLLAAALAARRSQLCFGPSTESSAAVCFEILQQSWGWDSHSQATMWLLLGFEAQGRGLSDSEELAIGCLESLASKAVPGPGPEFATGLMVLLRQLPATSRLVDCLLELPVGRRWHS